MSTPDLKIIEAAKTVYGLEIRRVDADFECGHDGASFKFEGELVQTGTRCSVFESRSFFARVLPPAYCPAGGWNAHTISNRLGCKSTTHQTRYGAVMAAKARKAKHESRDS